MLKKLEKWGEKAWEYVEDHEGTFVSYTARTIVLAKAVSRR